MKTFTIKDLTVTARLKLESGDFEVYDITQKHIKIEARKYFYTLKYKGESILFSHRSRTKILNYGI